LGNPAGIRWSEWPANRQGWLILDQKCHGDPRIGGPRFRREVVVVAHDHKRLQRSPRLRARLEKAGLERDLHPRGPEDVVPIVAAIDDVMIRPGGFEPELARHADILRTPPPL